MELLSGTIDIPGYIFYPVIVGLLLYLHTRYKFNYWRKQGVPAPTPLPFFGNLDALLFNKSLFLSDQENYNKYGHTFGLYEPGANVLMISDPEDIKTVFVKDFDKFPDRRALPFSKGDILKHMLSVSNGEKWSAIRNVISPTFSGAKMKYMINCLIECSEELTDCVIENSRKNKEFDLKGLFGAYTMDVIAGTAFRAKINSLRNPDHPFARNAEKVSSPGLNWRLFLALFMPKLLQKLNIPILDPEVIAFFSDAVRKIVRMRENEERSQDLLSLLKESMHDDAFSDNKSTKPCNDMPDEEWKKESKKFLSEDMVLAQCILFFLAGYDTTANTISMVSYNLATNPECQDKLIEEIDDALEKHGKLSYETIGTMPYLKAIVKETLRLHTPAVRIERRCKVNYQLGDIFLKEGTLIAVPVYSIHHDPEIWPNPETFDPERFLGENDVNAYTYMPFGVGRRNCVAMRFAEMEVKVAIATMLTKVKFFKSPSTSVPPVFSKKIGILKPVNMILGVKIRQNRTLEE